MHRPQTVKNTQAHPTASSSGAPLSHNAPIETVLADLEGLDREGLRRQWRNHLGGETPVHQPRWILVRVLAYRLQVAAFGGLDKSTRRLIFGTVEEGAAAPFDRRDPKTRECVELKIGAPLVREWQGKLERGMVLEEGFARNGKTYGSPSQIAKAMSGTKWNGHRFIGLREGKGRNDRKEASHRRGAGQDHHSGENRARGVCRRASI
jgi:Protein of unknown function (DUF2924)